MKRTGRHGGRGDVPGQLRIEWGTVAGGGPVVTTSPLPASEHAATVATPELTAPPQPLVQRLPWDFKSKFPEPMPEAIEAGVINPEDAEPENVRSLHEEHARELLVVLHDLDVVLDARRRGVDPRNNKAPMLAQAKERLQKFFETEPQRLEHWWDSQMDVYQSVFGTEAADAFGKAIRAWHAGIEVIAVTKPTPALADKVVPSARKQRQTTMPQVPSSNGRKRILARLPVPRPLPSAVKAGHFGQDENGKPVRPGAHEVREITEQHAEKLIELLDSLASAPATAKDSLRSQFDAAVAAYAEDFGDHAARQLEAYVRRQSSIDPESRHQR